MKLLMISSYRRQCGIAQYVEHLEPVLRSDPSVDLEIAALPVDLLRAGGKIATRMARQIMRSIAASAAAADAVILQYEPGLFGYSELDVWRNIKSFLDASKRVIITYHTFPSARRVSPLRAPREWLRQMYRSYSFRNIVNYSRRRPRQVFHLVQTRRERQRLLLLGVPEANITDLPLAFLSAPQRERFASGEYRAQLLERIGVKPKTVLGCFGFLAPYKGFDVAIDALQFLPQDTHLLIVGGIHPEGIEFGAARQKYVTKLTTQIDRLKLRERVHFLNAPGNDEFNEIMAACDAVVLPYAEVGQTSSGPAALALDLSKPTYCASNKCFRELDRYSPGVLSFFEIGNHMQLAQSIQRGEGESQRAALARHHYGERFNVERRVRAYLRLAGARPGAGESGLGVPDALDSTLKQIEPA